MEKIILEEIQRIKEIMGFNLISEGSSPKPKFLDDLIKKFANNANSGDSALRNRFDDFFESMDRKYPGKYFTSPDRISDLAAGAEEISDLFENLDDVYKFVDDLLLDSANGDVWKKYLSEALEESGDTTLKSVGKELKDVEDFVKEMDTWKTTDTYLFNQSVDSLAETKNLIDNSSLDESLKPIIKSKFGLDNIPKKISNEVVDEVSENSDSVLKGAKEILDPKKWPDTSGLSADEIEKIGKKVDENVKNWFRGWRTSSDTKLIEITRILKTLRESGTEISAPDKLALDKQLSKLMNDLYLNNRKLLSQVETWFDQISGNDYALKQIVSKLKGQTDSFKKILSVAESNGDVSTWIYSFKRALSDALAGEVRLLSRVFKTIENKEWFKKYFGESANKTAKEAEGGLWEWLYSGSRRGYPLSSNKNWKKVIEESGLPAAKKAYAMELLIRTAKWKIIFASLATLRNFTAFASNKTNLTQCKTALDNLKNEIDSNEKLSSQFKQGSEYLIPLEVTNDPNGNPYKTTSGTNVVIPNDCKINNVWQMWGQDFAQGEEGSRWPSDFSDNLLSTTWGDDLTDLFPGKLDDIVLFISDTLSWSQKDKTWEDFATHLDDQIIIAQKKIENGNEKITEVVNNTEEKIDDAAQQSNLDSLNVSQPDIPQVTTETIKKGTASEEDKISFRDYLNDINTFNLYTSIDKGNEEGTIVLTYKKKNENGEMVDKTHTIYRDNKGVWRYKATNNPY